MKKIFSILTVLVMSLFAVCAEDLASGNKFEFGIGSGYVFYGDHEMKDHIDSIGDPSQFVLAGDCAYLIRLNGPVYFCLGADILFDGHWNGGHHVYIWDYCGEAGFRIYPGIAGLACNVNYCLGRATEFYDLTDSEGSGSSAWGNGYKFGVVYDFSYNSDGIAPEIGINFRHMPRGGNESDNVFCVFLRLKK